MIERAVAARVPFAWFTADEAFGQNRGLRDWLQEQDIAYVMATRSDDEVAAGLRTVSMTGRPRRMASRKVIPVPAQRTPIHHPRILDRPRDADGRCPLCAEPRHT